MIQRIRIRSFLFILLLLSLLVGVGTAETDFVDKYADLKSNLSSGGEKTVILTADIIADDSITVNGKITLTAEANTNREISFASAQPFSDSFIYVGDGTILTIAGNRTGIITISGRTSSDSSLISVESGELRLEGVILKDNRLTGTDSRGGAVFVDGGKVSLDRTTISGCSADFGGAVYMTSSVEGYFNGVHITECSAKSGGGIYAGYETPKTTIPKNLHTKLTVYATSITKCSAEYDGGGIYVSAADLTLTNVNFADSMVYGKTHSVRADSSIVTLSSVQDTISSICLDKSVIHLKDKFSTTDNIGVELISNTAVTPYIMKTDSGKIRDIEGYFTFVLPDGFLTEADDKTLFLSVSVTMEPNGAPVYPFYTGVRCAVSSYLPIYPYKWDGYTFSGWALTPNGEAVYSNAGSVTLYEPTTLYAVWIKGDGNAINPAYIGTIADGGLVELTGNSYLQYIILPDGASGDFYIYDTLDVWIPEDMPVLYVFSPVITEYPAGGISVIGFSAENAVLYQYSGSEWTALQTVWYEDSNTFEAEADSLGVFAIAAEPSSAESPLGLFGILAGFGVVYCLRRR